MADDAKTKLDAAYRKNTYQKAEWFGLYSSKREAKDEEGHKEDPSSKRDGNDLSSMPIARTAADETDANWQGKAA